MSLTSNDVVQPKGSMAQSPATVQRHHPRKLILFCRKGGVIGKMKSEKVRFVVKETSPNHAFSKSSKSKYLDLNNSKISICINLYYV